MQTDRNIERMNSAAPNHTRSMRRRLRLRDAGGRNVLNGGLRHYLLFSA